MEMLKEIKESSNYMDKYINFILFKYIEKLIDCLNKNNSNTEWGVHNICVSKIYDKNNILLCMTPQNREIEHQEK